MRTRTKAAEGVRIRSMAASDVDAFMELEQQADSAPHWSREDYLACLQEGGDTTLRRTGMVAELGQLCAGFAILRCLTLADAIEVDLESIVVARELRGQGIGGRLLGSAIDIAKSRGAARLDLEVRESNEAAARLYKHFGFIETGRRPRYYASPEEDAVLMRLTW